MFSLLTIAISYNLPKLSGCATWNANGITFVDSTTVSNPFGVYVTPDNSVYVAVLGLSKVQVRLNGSYNATRTLTVNGSAPCDVFVTSNGDIYVDNGASQGRVDKWTLNATIATTVMLVNSSCYGLFVDILDNLYCSTDAPHHVVKRSPNDPVSSTLVVAGTGTLGSTSNMLHSARGIFVDIALHLYVADCGNHRIQRFPFEQPSGTTVAGNGATGTIILNCPIDVILDGNAYLFIVEFFGNRVVGSGANGFQCIAGCSGVIGSASNQLNRPISLSFDKEGSLFVTDSQNNRVQKFLLARNSCGKLRFRIRSHDVPNDLLSIQIQQPYQHRLAP